MINKVEWLKRNGLFPQYNNNTKVVIDKDGNTHITLHDEVKMKNKPKGNVSESKV